MNAPQLLPQIEQGRIIVDEGADLVDDHEKDGDVHAPCVRQGTIYIACTQSTPSGICCVSKPLKHDSMTQ